MRNTESDSKGPMIGSMSKSRLRLSRTKILASLGGVAIIGLIVAGAILGYHSVKKSSDKKDSASVQPEFTTEDQIKRREIQANESTVPEDKMTAYIAQGHVYMTQKKYKEALSAYQKADAIVPGNLDVQSDIAEAYFALTDKDNATKYYQKAISIAGTNEIYKGNVTLWQQRLEQLSKNDYATPQGFKDDGFNYN